MDDSVTRTRRKQKRFMTVEPWPDDEVSTRNCYHCLAPKDGIYVRCGKGYPMVATSGRHKRQLTYNGVIRLARLLKPCQSCADFDNDWG